MTLKRWTLAVTLLATALAPPVYAAASGDRVEPLGPVPDNIHKEFVFGNGRSVAWLTDTPKGQVLVLNGHRRPTF